MRGQYCMGGEDDDMRVAFGVTSTPKDAKVIG